MEIKRWKGKQDGSFTVEASLILSFAFVCLLLCVYGCLYLHDKAVLEGAAAKAGQRGRLYLTENQDMYLGSIDWDYFSRKGLLWRIFGADRSLEIGVYAAVLTEGKLLICDSPEFTVLAGNDTIKISYRAKTRLKGVGPAGRLLIPQISGTVTQKGLEAEEFVRLVRALTEGD